jgi:predicted negative regulator of RcsB-dependent stress response
MSEYKTDEEQIEDLKQWWRDNGKQTVIAIALTIGGFFGWQSWQQQQQDDVYAASAVYENLIAELSQLEVNASEQQTMTARHLADSLKADFPDSSYADFAALFNAKFAVEAKDYALAEQELRWILDNGAVEEVSLQATLRLARVFYAQQQYQEALTLLETDGKGYAAAYEEVKGDIYYAQGDLDKALLTYQKVEDINRQAENPTSSAVLGLKLEQLKSELAVVATPVKEES